MFGVKNFGTVHFTHKTRALSPLVTRAPMLPINFKLYMIAVNPLFMLISVLQKCSSVLG